ncbi:hypothetical protein CHS0354_027069, partial [Potamilus streckersoni]
KLTTFESDKLQEYAELLSTATHAGTRLSSLMSLALNDDNITDCKFTMRNNKSCIYFRLTEQTTYRLDTKNEVFSISL